MDPVGLGNLLNQLPQVDDPNLLVGFKTNDDAGIYRLTDDLALVTTADFITPPVNDAYAYGQIAAANAISDIYAMGGRPVTCLNLVCFPSKKLPPEDLHQIVAGALEKITEAGAVLAGGHSVEDSEPKFGLAVTGVVHPDRFWTNSGARAGDALILTKPVGSGVLFNANLKNWVSENAMAQCVAIVSTLNRQAAEILADYSPHAVTDVTGFGIAGHGLEMARGSGVTVHIRIDDLPVMDQALAMYRKGMNTGTNAFNRQLVADATRFERALPAWHEQIVYDPQTSGGLLAAMPADQSDEAVRRLRAADCPHAAVIGHASELEGADYLVFS